MPAGFDLSVDFGTSSTGAVVRLADGRTRSVLFDGSALLPSAVCLDASGRLLVGRDAVAGGRMYPGAIEPNPKRCIDDGEILLGERALPVPEVIGAVLGHVYREAGRIADTALSRVVLTHPVAWQNRRQEVLRAAAEHAGIPAPALVAEPIAAATGYLAGSAARLDPGGCVLVYDLGGGTFDASIVRRTADGFEVLASEGLPDAGGLDIDAAIVANVAATYAGQRPEAWQRMQAPGEARARRQLWDDVRAAKELLSRMSSAIVHLPVLGIDVPIGREQLEHLARPVLERTIACTKAAIANAGIGSKGLTGILLVGGASRMPLVGTLLHRAFAVAPATFEQPELVVAEGAIEMSAPAALAPAPAAEPAPPAPAPPAPVPPPAPAPMPERVRPRRRARIVGALAGGLAAVSVATALVWNGIGDADNGARTAPSNGTISVSGTASAMSTPKAISSGYHEPFCSWYTFLKFTKVSGAGATAPIVEARACTSLEFSQGKPGVYVGGDFKHGTASAYKFEGSLKMYDCSGKLLDESPQAGSQRGGVPQATNELARTAVELGVAADYLTELTISIDVTDDGGTLWRSDTTVIRSPCYTPPG